MLDPGYALRAFRDDMRKCAFRDDLGLLMKRGRGLPDGFSSLCLPGLGDDTASGQ